MSAPKSPEFTTSAILGASSAGWSPQRPSRRQMTSDEDTLVDYAKDSEPEHGSPSRTSIPEHRANLGALRSHGLVSNSIFKSSTNSSPSNPSAYSPTPSRVRSPQHDGSPSRMGVGLGICATQKERMASPVRADTILRSTSNSSIGSQMSASSDEENEQSLPFRNQQQGSPRKSTNFRRLEQRSYVTNSPFRRGGPTLPQTEASEAAAARTHQSPNASPSKRQSQMGMDRPQTPEAKMPLRSNGDEFDLGTPTSSSVATQQRQSPGNADSPTRGGLLVSNRLLGPRQMENGSATNSPHESPSRRERRKTVTFDEILDVQEFDRESSYDHESLRSGGSELSVTTATVNECPPRVDSMTRSGSSSDEDEAMWLNEHDHGARKVVERLMIVNGSPASQSSAFSTPELEHATPSKQSDAVLSSEQANDASSNDSQDLSSLDEPHSPSPHSPFHTTPRASAPHGEAQIFDAESADVSGGNLSEYGALHRVESMVDELLGDQLLDAQQVKQQQTRSAQSAHPFNLDNSLNFDSPPRRRRNIHQPSEVKVGAVSNVETARRAQEEQTTASTSPSAVQPQQPKAGSGRPHISRDAILQRVAREKQIQEERQSGSSGVRGQAPALLASPIENARDENARLQGVQPPAMSHAAAGERPTSVRMSAHQAQGSPLERLGAAVRSISSDDQERGWMDNTLRASNESPSTRDRESEREREGSWFAEPLREGPSDLEREADDHQSRVPANVGASQPAQSAPVGLTPAQQAEQIIARRRSKNGHGPATTPLRTRPRRSLSEGDVSAEHQEVLNDKADDAIRQGYNEQDDDRRRSCMLDSNVLRDVRVNEFESGLQRELSRIYRQGDSKYRVKDRGVFEGVESSANSKVDRPLSTAQASTSKAADDSNVRQQDKAWRKLRRPSDMNEYAREMREYRARENPKKMTGKVFVMVDSFTPTNLPVPSQPTRFFCILDNGLHIVRTATSGLRLNGPSKIGQEFELIQHKNLKFSLTLVAQRDKHLQPPSEVETSPASSKRDRMTPSFSRGVGKLFSSPKKRTQGSASTASLASTTYASHAQGQHEPMLAYLNREGAFGQATIAFERVAHDCLAKCLVVDLPVHGINDPMDASNGAESLSRMNSAFPRTASLANDFAQNLQKIRGTLRLKLFYLPPLPGVAKALLPENLSQSIKGMEAARWHASRPSIEGTLTQLGGDCQSWRRRPVKVQGVYLIGFNEITKKPTVKIDLSKAVSVEETKDPVKGAGHGISTAAEEDELDETYHVERSFRVTFRDGERIYFFADTDKEMHMWLEALRGIVGAADAPAQCVWAQVVLDLLKTNEEQMKKPTASKQLAVASK